jgi:hypothetical protein
VIDYYESKMKTPAGFVEGVGFCSCNPLQLVLALKEAGHPDFEAVLEAWKQSMERLSALYARSGDANAARGDIAALQGDFAAAQALYAAAMDLGWRSPLFTSRRLRNFLPADAGFDALLARMTSLIDAERASLGMPPMEQSARELQTH